MLQYCHRLHERIMQLMIMLHGINIDVHYYVHDYLTAIIIMIHYYNIILILIHAKIASSPAVGHQKVQLGNHL